MSRKICVYAICRNESAFVDRWMDSMSEADEVIVTDTGSGDDTVEKLQSRGAIVYKETVDPWRFDVARNLSLEHVPQDAGICVCTDLDECFVPGWRSLLEAAWEEGSTRARYLYNWSHRPDGSPDVQFYYEKIHARQGYFWRWPVHEYLQPQADLTESVVTVPGLTLDHYPDAGKSRSNYLPLLEMAVREEPTSDRMTFYLGREYSYVGNWQACVQTLTRHLNLCLWTPERCASMRLLAQAFHRLGDERSCLSWHYRAIAEEPGMREPYVEFAMQAHEWGNWPLVYFLTKQALAINDKSTVYLNQGYAWDHTPDDLCAIACYRLGLLDEALEHLRRALALSPHEPRLLENLALMEKGRTTP